MGCRSSRRSGSRPGFDPYLHRQSGDVGTHASNEFNYFNNNRLRMVTPIFDPGAYAWLQGWLKLDASRSSGTASNSQACSGAPLALTPLSPCDATCSAVDSTISGAATGPTTMSSLKRLFDHYLSFACSQNWRAPPCRDGEINLNLPCRVRCSPRWPPSSHWRWHVSEIC